MPCRRPPWLLHAPIASALTVVALLAAFRSACAEVFHGTIPSVVTLVGLRGGVVDPIGEFTVTVRDLAGNVVPNVHVNCDLSGCTDLRLGVAQLYLGYPVNCNYPGVTADTNWLGVATFRIIGGALNTGGAPGAGFAAMSIYANGYFLGFVTVSAVDQTGFDGLTASDLSAWMADYMSGTYVGRSDFDGSHTLGANDVSILAMYYFSGGSSQGAGSVIGGICP